MTDRTQGSDRLASWIRGYRRAWESNDPADITALFTDDADYFEAPHQHPWHGHDAIVAGWLAARDEPGDTAFEWETVAETPEVAIVRAVSRYAAGPVYDNLWVIRFAPDGRATSYTDWWVERPADTANTDTAYTDHETQEENPE
ncbi:nuclear transport factor 2 family protein [Herbiconiux sp.]|jgi:uncharacterized protein (TIGR02246 family)|uniref:nuclear transport factor 2 family protein n=1 Tax=Herbiconiux sp. TaxID=1871186 RepID=UPI0025B7D830|nr:nuclear transport factor 2 family protein [Herbiconiux sp.]